MKRFDCCWDPGCSLTDGVCGLDDDGCDRVYEMAGFYGCWRDRGWEVEEGTEEGGKVWLAESRVVLVCLEMSSSLFPMLN